MPQIGEFTRTASGFSGHIRSAVLDVAIAMVEVKENDIDNGPDYRIYRGDSNGPEVGAAWKRNGEKAGEYLSLVIDDPTFALPLRANLFQSTEPSTWHLQWNRPPKPSERA